MMIVLGVTKIEALGIALGLMVITASISTLSGLWGVLWTDLFQFVLKMGMVILLAVFAVGAAAGLSSLKSSLAVVEQNRHSTGSVLSFLPDLHSTWMPFVTFFVYIAVNWWASWYPGAEPGGGGYIAQRIFSAKDERNGVLSVLWFNIAHYALRPWPWILTALAAIVLYPHLEHPETGYMLVVSQHVPPALRGIVVAGFMAAFMSTIATQLNWGASYLVSDFYRRFLKKDGTDAHYVTMSRVATVLLVIVAAWVSAQLAS